ncbi:THO complex subunit 6 [Hibiscus syriacus]|uniref:THO complex subunit 6 n=1 Tax=Hibiscus syriacus TaxID=106335 RepID=A0A6A2WHI4_HIBSY|nr:THO complex subunit 6 [Hibiscus syriacus]
MPKLFDLGEWLHSRSDVDGNILFLLGSGIVSKVNQRQSCSELHRRSKPDKDSNQRRMCGDATNWDEEAYRESILREREIQTRTVFRTVWAPSLNPNPECVVVASSDGSIASYSISSCVSKHPIGFCGARAQRLLPAEPEGFLEGHDGPAYDVKFYGNGEDSLLLSCGDDGKIKGWRWKEFTESEVPITFQGNHMKPVLDLINPQDRGPWGALSPIPENNAIAVDPQGGSIFSAAGDSCAYCWDVIITGSEDGTARIWGNIVVLIFKCYRELISCYIFVSACGNGRNLSVWNLTAAECISSISSGATIQDAVFDNHQILAVGADPVLNRFDMNGTILSQIQCAPQSAFSVSLHPSGVTAIGGYGGIVDVISQFGSHLCTFRSHCV